MSSWLSDYISALEARDASEHANEAIINAYTKLADSKAALEKEARSKVTAEAEASPTTASTTKDKGRGSASAMNPTSPLPLASTDIARLRIDLGAAQKSKVALETQIASVTDELATLRMSSTASNKNISLLTRQKASLERKLQDRDLELKEKARLVESVQDDMVGMQLELNVAEEKVRKIEQENQELIDRWMKRVGREAENMNEEYSWK